MTPEVTHQIKTVDFVINNVLGGIFSNAPKCLKCNVLLDENGECHNGCPEQEFCAGLCGTHHDIDDNEGWDDDGNEPWFCDVCADEFKRNRQAQWDEQKARDKQFRGW